MNLFGQMKLLYFNATQQQGEIFRKVNYEPSFWKEPVVEPPLKSIATEHATAVHNSTECDKIVVPHVKPRRVDVGEEYHQD